jgi:hypothetical protein
LKNASQKVKKVNQRYFHAHPANGRSGGGGGGDGGGRDIRAAAHPGAGQDAARRRMAATHMPTSACEGAKRVLEDGDVNLIK